MLRGTKKSFKPKADHVFNEKFRLLFFSVFDRHISSHHVQTKSSNYFTVYEKDATLVPRFLYVQTLRQRESKLWKVKQQRCFGFCFVEYLLSTIRIIFTKNHLTITLLDGSFTFSCWIHCVFCMFIRHIMFSKRNVKLVVYIAPAVNIPFKQLVFLTETFSLFTT